MVYIVAPVKGCSPFEFQVIFGAWALFGHVVVMEAAKGKTQNGFVAIVTVLSESHRRFHRRLTASLLDTARGVSMYLFFSGHWDRGVYQIAGVSVDSGQARVYFSYSLCTLLYLTL